MATKKLYLYWILSRDSLTETPADVLGQGVLLSHQWPLVGLDRSIWPSYRLRNFEKKISIKPFEVTQDLFYRFIEFASTLNTKIISISFTEDLSEDEYESLRQLIRNEDAEGIISFCEDQRYHYERDIEQLSFVLRKSPTFSPITFSREAVMTVENGETLASELLSMPPVGVLSGTFVPDDNNMVNS